MGESFHGDHVHLVRCGPLLHFDVLGAYPSLYARGGRSGHRSYEVVGGIARRGGGHWRDCYMELCMRSTWEARPSQVARPFHVAPL